MGKASTYIPALSFGHKIYPEDLAGMIGLPSVGEIFYVDPGKASGVSGGGKTRTDAFLTVAEAYAAMTADQDDVCVISSSSSTGRTSETDAITWAKRRTHIVGNGPLRKINPRNGISFTSAATGDPSFTVSATNCSFTNISIANFNNVNVLVDVTAAYNTFNYVHFQGIGHATAGDDTAARSLRISGADETLVTNSTIGLDTVTRSTTNASLEVTGTCARTQFENCDFPIFTDNAGPIWVKAVTGNCTERYMKFVNCMFMNPSVVGSSTTMTVGMDTAAATNGTIVLDACGFLGMTNIADDFTAVHSINTPTVPTQATAAFMQVLA